MFALPRRMPRYAMARECRTGIAAPGALRESLPECRGALRQSRGPHRPHDRVRPHPHRRVCADGLGHVSPIAQDLAARLAPPESAHWFGTDELGRDIYAPHVYGARVTLTIVVLVSVVVAPIGLAVGTAAVLPRRLGRYDPDADHRLLSRFSAPRAGACLCRGTRPRHRKCGDRHLVTAWPPYARTRRVPKR